MIVVRLLILLAGVILFKRKRNFFDAAPMLREAQRNLREAREAKRNKAESRFRSLTQAWSSSQDFDLPPLAL